MANSTSLDVPFLPTAHAQNSDNPSIYTHTSVCFVFNCSFKATSFLVTTSTVLCFCFVVFFPTILSTAHAQNLVD